MREEDTMEIHNFDFADENETFDWLLKIIGKSMVKQDCIMSGFLFLQDIDWVMRKTTADERRGIQWKFTTLILQMMCNLDFVDDIALLSSKFNGLHENTERWADEAARVGAKTECKKV